MSTIHFIGGEKGGVGKSVVARLCAQYCIDRAIPFVAADADGSHGALLRFYADYTRPVDLAEFESADVILALATESDRAGAGRSAGAERSPARRLDPGGAASWSSPPRAAFGSCSGT